MLPAVYRQHTLDHTNLDPFLLQIYPAVFLSSIEQIQEADKGSISR
jgi:hypothetical protein